MPRQPTPKWKLWGGGLVMLAFVSYLVATLASAGRRFPAMAHGLSGIALFFLGLDIYYLSRRRSTVAAVTSFFAASAIIAEVPDLALGIPLAVAAVLALFGVPALVTRSRR